MGLERWTPGQCEIRSRSGERAVLLCRHLLLLPLLVGKANVDQTIGQALVNNLCRVPIICHALHGQVLDRLQSLLSLRVLYED